MIIQILNKLDRYIAEELILSDTNEKYPKNEVFIVDDIYEALEEIPDIILCKDCKYIKEVIGKKGYYFCQNRYSSFTTPDDFCSRGERR